jgi:hypothetical protein
MTFVSGAHFVINRAWALHHKLDQSELLARALSYGCRPCYSTITSKIPSTPKSFGLALSPLVDVISLRFTACAVPGWGLE